MGFILDMFSLAVYIPFLQVDEEDISRNAVHLKKYSWFQALLHDQTCRDLIIYHPDVRRVIGRFKTDKIHKKQYNLRCEHKLLQALQRAM
ncbi:hypothetical protein BSA171_15325 [Bacillus safensis]|uniref:hypothetical protein n=1 Tax=Bacillus TaxID=1386 RepID=UPI00094BD956|nr:hypothetical protein [Bacillus safensis]APT48839.1 hypothetical protein BSA41_02390 [Bacillus safensis]APT54885.1 hypothetical protein BSA171_15325 [Bacillus safensis]MCZ2739813.1 hypothetical protein [Bacillus safensis]